MTDNTIVTEVNEVKIDENKGIYSSVIGRILWVMMGPAVLVLTLHPIYGEKTAFGIWDAIYGVNWILMIAGRFIELESGRGLTLYDEPLTRKNSRVYAVLVTVVAAAAWTAVKVWHHR